MRQGGSVSLPCRRNNHGRYVYVMLRGRNYLTLCEVEVYSEGGTILNFHKYYHYSTYDFCLNCCNLSQQEV